VLLQGARSIARRRRLGTRPRTRSILLLVGRRGAGCTWFATCDKDPMSSRLTGPQFAESRRWITAAGARPDRLRPAGDVGELADRLAKGHGDGLPPYRWTSHRTLVSPEGGNLLHTCRTLRCKYHSMTNFFNPANVRELATALLPLSRRAAAA
jgi:hypothetical protein